jgi:hypothetical protein
MKQRFFLIVVFFSLFATMGFSQQVRISSPFYDNITNGIVIGQEIPAQATTSMVRMGTASSFNRTMVVENVTSTGTHGISFNFTSVGPSSAVFRYGLTAQLEAGNAWDIALFGRSRNSTPRTAGRSFGLWAVGGNATSGWNYGVFAELYGSNNGAAVVGKLSTTTMIPIPEQYAGFFMGRTYISERLGIGTGAMTPSFTLDVRGNVGVNGVIVHGSDSRLKNNVVELGSSLDLIKRLRPVTYNLAPFDYSKYYELLRGPAVSDTSIIVINNDDDLRRYLALDNDRDVKRKHIGFIAQELMEIFPELVYEDEKGMLGVDYISLIPVLVGTIQELSNTVQTLNMRLEAMENRERGNYTNVQTEVANNFSFSLFPNPTTGFVTIDYTLHVDSPINIELYNLMGQRIKLITSQQKQRSGTYKVQTSVADLGSGTYIVKVTGGNQVESKQLIINNN